jgi:hypothetical protein
VNTMYVICRHDFFIFDMIVTPIEDLSIDTRRSDTLLHCSAFVSRAL